MALRVHKKWLPVVGEHVEIKLMGRTVRAGRVDAVTDDDSVLWVAADGAVPRQLFARADGYEVWINYRWEG